MESSVHVRPVCQGWSSSSVTNWLLGFSASGQLFLHSQAPTDSSQTFQPSSSLLGLACSTFLLCGDSEGNWLECYLGLIQTLKPFRYTNRETAPHFQGAGNSLGKFIARRRLEKLNPQGVFICEVWWKSKHGQVLRLFPSTLN